MGNSFNRGPLESLAERVLPATGSAAKFSNPLDKFRRNSFGQRGVGGGSSQHMTSLILQPGQFGEEGTDASSGT